MGHFCVHFIVIGINGSVAFSRPTAAIVLWTPVPFGWDHFIVTLSSMNGTIWSTTVTEHTGGQFGVTLTDLTASSTYVVDITAVCTLPCDDLSINFSTPDTIQGMIKERKHAKFWERFRCA